MASIEFLKKPKKKIFLTFKFWEYKFLCLVKSGHFFNFCLFKLIGKKQLRADWTKWGPPFPCETEAGDTRKKNGRDEVSYRNETIFSKLFKSEELAKNYQKKLVILNYSIIIFLSSCIPIISVIFIFRKFSLSHVHKNSKQMLNATTFANEHKFLRIK
jgi:hypothetical protein